MEGRAQYYCYTATVPEVTQAFLKKGQHNHCVRSVHHGVINGRGQILLMHQLIISSLTFIYAVVLQLPHLVILFPWLVLISAEVCQIYKIYMI